MENEAEVSESEDSVSEEERIDKPFCVKTWKDDLTIIVEDKKLHVSKATLGLVSPVFDKMFTAEFIERDSDELQLPHKNYDDFLAFLQCAYPGVDQNDVTAANAGIVAPLADEYQVEKLLSTCDSVLADSLDYSAKTSDIYKHLKLASAFKLPKLQTKCIEYASERELSDMLKNKETYEIPSEVHEKVVTAGLWRRELDIKDYKAVTQLTTRSPKDICRSHGASGRYNISKLLELRIADKIGEDTESIEQIIMGGCKDFNESNEYFVYLPARLKKKCHLIKAGLKE